MQAQQDRPNPQDDDPKSPDELRADLPDARSTRAGDVAKARTIADIPAWVIELGMIENIEEFTPNLEGFLLGDGDSLRYPEISIVESRAVKEPAIRSAESSALRARCGPGNGAGGRNERALIKIRERLRAGGVAGIPDVNRPHYVRHIRAGTSGKRSVPHALVHLDGETCGKASDTLDLPALRQALRPAWECPIERNGPNVAGHEIMVHVGGR